MTLISLPSVRFRRLPSFHPQHQSRGGGPATDGSEQVVVSNAGRWGTVADIVIKGQAQFLAWEAFRTAMEGRSNTVALPFPQHRRAPWPVDAYGRTLSPGFVRDKRLDDTGFAYPAIPDESEITIQSDDAFAIGARTIDMRVDQGSAPKAGMYFEHATQRRLYQITAITGVVGNVYTATIWPGLRQALGTNSDLEFIEPTCEMRFASDDEGQIWDDGSGFATVECEFVESV